MKILKFLSIIAIALIATACPYANEIPLSTPSEKVPQQLLGKWLSPTDADAELENNKMMPEYRQKLTPTFYVITGIDKTSMKIEKHEYQSSDSTYTIKLHTAHTTKIGNQTFINIMPSDESKYYFYRMEFPDANSLELYPVTDYIKDTFSSSEEMKSFFDKYKELSFFYSEKEEYRRSK